ncbi:transglutaminase family protein [Nocardia caishijiensis]|uniref:Transglutaminase-like putative cysteine protease n=1 Tax=Nocardia caishijiensis TaxID=184756 RepID=A0ABQ6YFH7_9NOCA|nr:transglutaminase family protein [Nocardia caishijiensis]KAF0836733.1 transglutaminase-like putative cysteine protease [Nocardia caishijiensis]
MSTYRVLHRTTYAYSDEVSSSYGRAYLTPREFPGQRLLAHDIQIEPGPSDRSAGPDVYGNSTTYFHVTQAHQRLVVTAESLVDVDPPPPPDADLPWEQARPTASTGPLAVEFTFDLTPPEITADVAAYAARSFTPGRPLIEAVTELNSRIHHDFHYRTGSTTVSTSVADVFAAREGVCQDFARLAAACLRSHGLAARYVSGYLATDPPPGRERMIGADATHAWTAVWTPTTWLPFDPTNNQLPDERYTTLAWGRDYQDVAPLRGIIYTEAATSTIDVSVDVAPVG